MWLPLRCFAGSERLCGDNAGSVCRSGRSAGSTNDGHQCACLRDSDRGACDNADENCFWFPIKPGVLPHNLTSTNQTCVFVECFDGADECPEYLPHNGKNCTTKSQDNCFCGNPDGPDDKLCQANDFNCVHMFKNKKGIFKETAKRKHCFIEKYNQLKVCYEDKRQEKYCGTNASKTCWNALGESICTCVCAEKGCLWNYVEDATSNKIVESRMKCSYDNKFRCFAKDGQPCGKDAADSCEAGKNASATFGGPECVCKARDGRPCSAQDGAHCIWYVGDQQSLELNTNAISNPGQPCHFVDHRCLIVPQRSVACPSDENPLRCRDSTFQMCSCRLRFKNKAATNISCPEDPEKRKGASCFWHDSAGYPTSNICDPALQQCYEWWRSKEKCDVSRDAICFTGFEAETDVGCACLEVSKDNKAKPCFRNSTTCAWYYKSSISGLFIQTYPKQECGLRDKLCVEKLPHMDMDKWDDVSDDLERCTFWTHEEPQKSCVTDATARPCTCRLGKDPSRLCQSKGEDCFWSYPEGGRHLLTSSHCHPPVPPCLRLDLPKEECRVDEAPANCPRCKCVDALWHHDAIGITNRPCTSHPAHQEP